MGSQFGEVDDAFRGIVCRRREGESSFGRVECVFASGGRENAEGEIGGSESEVHENLGDGIIDRHLFESRGRGGASPLGDGSMSWADRCRSIVIGFLQPQHRV